MRVLIDSSGKIMGTSPCRDMKVEVSGRGQGFVRLKTRHDSLKFAARNEGLLEKRYLAHKGPNSRCVSIRTDVLKAVRLAKHIREGYEGEKGSVQNMLTAISGAVQLLNAHSKMSKRCYEDLSQASELLHGVLEMMKRTRTFYKLISRRKIENALISIGNAYEVQNDFELNKCLKPATSVLYAAKRRLERRLEGIDGIYNYNLLREMLLRGIRDYYIWGRLACLAKWLGYAPKAAIDAYIQDMGTYNRMVRLMERCKAGEMADEAMKQYFVDDFIALGRALAAEKGKEYAVRMLRNAYVLSVKHGRHMEACGHFQDAIVYIGLNKPFYIAEQLEKTCDDYTGEIILKLREADQAILGRDANTALAGLVQLLGIYERIFGGYVPRPVAFDSARVVPIFNLPKTI